MAQEELLASWNDTATRAAIVGFVTGAAQDVAPEDRIATFDNDGTLWCEKPMPIELGHILQRLAAMAEKDAGLRTKQPWQAAYEEDYAWLGNVITKHYNGDDADVKVLMGGILAAFGGTTVDEYEQIAHDFICNTNHPTLGRPFNACAYQPMVELLRYLEANGFTPYIASGGDRDFMRPISTEVYGIPPERVIGSSNALAYEDGDGGGRVVYKAEPDYFDDGPAKPVRIWSRVGRRPLFAGGNSNGDIPMLRFATGFKLLVDHDDADREFAYPTGAEQAVRTASEHGWTVVSIKDDWSRVFPDA